jgi:hypothetical protein
MLSSVELAGMRIGGLFAGGYRAKSEDLRESECQETHIGRVTMRFHNSLPFLKPAKRKQVND